MEKPTRPGEPVKARLVADFRGVNKKLRRPEHPLEGSSGILKRLNPKHKYFVAVDMSSGFSQIPLAEESRNLFTVMLQGASPGSQCESGTVRYTYSRINPKQ